MSISLTDEARRYLTPRDASEADRAVPVAKRWAALAAQVPLVRKHLALMRSRWPEPVVARVESLLAVFDAGEPAGMPPSEALVSWIRGVGAGPAREALIGWLASRESPAAALGLVLDAQDRESDATPAGLPFLSTVLRSEVLRASSDERAAVRAVIAARWAGASAYARAVALDVSPDEPAWAAELGDAFLDTTTKLSLAGGAEVARVLVARLSDPERLERVLARQGASANVVDVLRTLGDDAAPLLVRLLDGTEAAHARKHLARALACIDTEDASRALARGIAHAAVRPFAAEHFARFPHRAPAALSALAGGKGKLANIAKELLEAHALAERASEHDPKTNAPEKPSRRPTTRRAPTRDLPGSRGDSAATNATGTLWCLASPPWHAAKRQPRKPIVVALEGRDASPQRRGDDASLESIRVPLVERARAMESWRRARAGRPEMARPDAEAWVAELRASPKRGGWRDDLPLDVELAVFGDWPAGCPYPRGLPLRMVAAAGLAALEGLCWWTEHGLPTTTYLSDGRVLLDVESPRLAVPIARLLGHAEHDALARLWLRTYPKAALSGLLPVAIGPIGPARAAAERALRLLAGRGHRATLDALVRTHGDAATAAVAEVFDAARWDCPKKPPKLPPALRPEALPAPSVDGAPLAPDQVRMVLEMLRFSDVEPRYVGLDLLREHAEPRSLAAFAWALASTWQMTGSKKSEEWMLFALAHLGDDEAVRRTTPALRAPRVVELLATVATDAALVELSTIVARGAQQTGGPFAAYGGMVDRARTAIADEARVRGIAPDALSESLVPTCALDGDGSASLDYGARRFRVGFDAHLSPVVLDDAGATLVNLPPARKEDDPACVASAQARWRELREDVEAIATRVLESLDRAMIDGRTWLLRDWRTRFVEHPLLRHVARRIVWERLGDDGRIAGTFRVAEDSTLADEHDAPITPSDAERVRIAHPWRLSAAEVSRWQRLSTDYEIVEAFPQLSRTRPAVPDVPEGAVAIRRAALADTSAWARDLAARGWVNGGWSVEHLGSMWWMAIGEIAVLLVQIGKTKEAELSFWRDAIEPAAVSSIDPVWIAEAVRAAALE